MEITCFGCGDAFFVDDKEYANYTGKLTCPVCFQAHFVKIRQGRLADMMVLSRRKLNSRDLE